MSTTLIEAGATLAASVVGPYATVKLMKQDKPKNDPPPQESPAPIEKHDDASRA